jgi:hypothetical protein
VSSRHSDEGIPRPTLSWCYVSVRISLLELESVIGRDKPVYPISPSLRPLGAILGLQQEISHITARTHHTATTDLSSIP